MNELVSIQKRLISFIQDYINEVVRLVSSPKDFYQQLNDQKGFLEPTLFAGANILIPKLFFALIFAPLTFGFSLLLVIPAVFYGICSLFIGTIILHGLIRLSGGTDNFEASYRCVAYASVALFSWLIPLPFINVLVFTVAFSLLLYYGIQESHDLNAQQTLLVLILPAFLIFLTGAVLSILSIWLMWQGLNSMIHIFLPA